MEDSLGNNLGRMEQRLNRGRKMIYNFGTTTSSHVPILLEFINKFKPVSIIEFGGGIFSTSIFSKFCKHVTTVEHNAEWVLFLRKKFEGMQQVKILQMDSQTILHNFVNVLKKYDLSFIDTQNKVRASLIQLSTRFTDNIICHDAQAPFLKKIRVIGFKRVNFKQTPYKYKNGSRPWTSLFTKNKEVLNYFSGLDEKELYKKFVFPYGIKK